MAGGARSPGNVESRKVSFVEEVDTMYIFRVVWNNQRSDGIINIASDIDFNTRPAIWKSRSITPFNSSYIVMFNATARMIKPRMVVRFVHTVLSKVCNDIHMTPNTDSIWNLVPQKNNKQRLGNVDGARLIIAGQIAKPTYINNDV